MRYLEPSSTADTPSLPATLCQVVSIVTMRSNRINSDQVDLSDRAGSGIPHMFVENAVGHVA